jgi:hypothetical protein
MTAAKPSGWAPVYRVVRRTREIEDLQRAFLESEGVLFNPSGRVDLERYRWLPWKTATAKSAAPKASQKKTQPRARAGATL